MLIIGCEYLQHATVEFIFAGYVKQRVILCNIDTTKPNWKSKKKRPADETRPRKQFTQRGRAAVPNQLWCYLFFGKSLLCWAVGYLWLQLYCIFHSPWHTCSMPACVSARSLKFSLIAMVFVSINLALYCVNWPICWVVSTQFDIHATYSSMSLFRVDWPLLVSTCCAYGLSVVYF